MTLETPQRFAKSQPPRRQRRVTIRSEEVGAQIGRAETA